jgi:hypothetical protein
MTQHASCCFHDHAEQRECQTIPSITNPPPPRNGPKANGVYVPAINKKIAA